MSWSDAFSTSGRSLRRPHPARQTRRVLGVAGASCFASLVWVISAEAESPVSYDLAAALQPPPGSLVVSNAPGLTLDGGATPATTTPAVTPPPGAALTSAPSTTSAPATTVEPAPTQTAAPAPTAPPDTPGDHTDHSEVITIPPTTNGTFDTSSGGS